MTVRIVLVDDRPVVRAGLRALLEGQEDFTVVGEAGDAGTAAAVVRDQRPDVVLMDLNLGAGEGGAQVTAALRAEPDPPEVLVLTTYDTDADVLRTLEAGARRYLLKDAPPAELFASIGATTRGETVLAPTVAAMVVRRAGPGGRDAVTEREVEVLELLSRGLGNKEMARELFVSEATVKSHLSHIYARLGVDTRAGAVATAIDRRTIST